MRVLVTGGAGFIGHHLIEHCLRMTKYELVILDRLDISGSLHRLHEVMQNASESQCRRVSWVYHDFKAPINEYANKAIGHVDAIFHLGASTHVDRSIDDPISFVYDNVVGTANILWWMKQFAPKSILIYFSTDEVFGPAKEGEAFKEWDRYHSTNPYSASKAGGEELCLAFANTYGLDIRISHCMNVFGERQHKEKFIPLVVGKVLNGEIVSIHANKERTKAGSRFYIHARNVADAVLFVLEHGVAQEKYNIVGMKEVDNLTLAQMIADLIEKPLKYELVDFHSSRPGHDLRYALNGSKLASMGWIAPVHFEASLEKTIKWTLNNSQWL